MDSFINTFLYVFAALIPIVNPIGAAMFFLTLLPELTPEQRSSLSLRVAVYCFLLSMVCLYTGSFILSFFGISIGVLRMAGGIVLFTAGWTSLNGPSKAQKNKTNSPAPSPEDLISKAFYPLTLPLTIGPGAIAVATAIGSSMDTNVWTVSGATAATFATCFVIWLCFRYSEVLTKKLGATGVDAITRIFAFILVCLGVEIFWTGFSELWIELSKKLISP